MDDKKELEILEDDGSSLNISPAYGHLNAIRPKPDSEKPTNIIVPKEIPLTEKKENSDTDDNKDSEDEVDKNENNETSEETE